MKTNGDAIAQTRQILAALRPTGSGRPDAFVIQSWVRSGRLTATIVNPIRTGVARSPAP